MDYESLGRYTEAMEKLPRLTDEMQSCMRTIATTARDTDSEAGRLAGFHIESSDPVRMADKLRRMKAAIERAEILNGEISALTESINIHAASCGRKKLNIRYD